MKKLIFTTAPVLLLLTSLCGCNGVGDKATKLSFVYGGAAMVSLLLLIACCVLVRKNKGWFLLMFSSVLIVNAGYTLLSVSTCLQMALWANRLAYFGSVFLPFSMFMIILDVTGTKRPEWLHWVLGVLSIATFLIAASPGVLPIYYKEVSFAVIDGVSVLQKVYGPLHPIYLVYLLGYFAAMVAVIIRARLKKTLGTAAHAIVLCIAVFVNLGVWFIEQLSSIDFEFLSVSYIISELFLLGIHFVMNEFQRMSGIVRQVEAAQKYSGNDPSKQNAMFEPLPDSSAFSPESVDFFLQGLESLTPTERAIYEAHVARVTSKEIMASLNIKESTLKYHNRNIYGKLGISSRKELLEMHKHLTTISKHE